MYRRVCPAAKQCSPFDYVFCTLAINGPCSYPLQFSIAILVDPFEVMIKHSFFDDKTKERKEDTEVVNMFYVSTISH